MDLLARAALAPGGAAVAGAVAEFGHAILGADGTIDRDRLAAVVFRDPPARRRLERIVHPVVAEQAAAATATAPPGAVVVHEVPLLVEAGLAGRYDVVVAVQAPEAVRLGRLTELRGMDPADARARMAAQASDGQRAAVADFVILNDGTPAELVDRVRQVWSCLTDMAGRAE
jgi:dephospho-CoA kinase